jgi:hypothetical protein
VSRDEAYLFGIIRFEHTILRQQTYNNPNYILRLDVENIIFWVSKTKSEQEGIE